jgi:hypothetical protein
MNAFEGWIDLRFVGNLMMNGILVENFHERSFLKAFHEENFAKVFYVRSFRKVSHMRRFGKAFLELKAST